VSSCRPLLSSTATNVNDNNNNNNEELQQSGDKAVEKKGLFGEWPWYPLIGLGTITGISKEILILNDELVFVSMFLAFTTGVYITVGPTISQWFDSKIDHHRSSMLECCDIAIDTCKRFITIENRNKSFPEDLKELYEEETKMTSLAVDYQNKKHLVDAREAVLQKLATIKALEDEERNSYKKALLSYTVDYVRDKYSELPSNEKSAHIDALINNLPTREGTKVVEDFIVTHFREFINQQYTPQELGVANRVPLFLQKEEKEAKAKH
jgi:hypothetical protein